jgi:hypothetical protein
MLYKRVVGNDLRVKAFHGCVEICDAVLGKEMDEIQASDGILPFRGGERCTRSLFSVIKETVFIEIYL